MVVYVWAGNRAWLEQVDVGSLIPHLWGRDQTEIGCFRRREDYSGRWDCTYVALRDDTWVPAVGWSMRDGDVWYDKRESEQHPLGPLITKGLMRLYGANMNIAEGYLMLGSWGGVTWQS